MDIAALAAAFVAARMGQVQLAVAGKILRSNMDMQASTVQTLLGSAQQSATSLANVAAGIGSSLDITV